MNTYTRLLLFGTIGGILGQLYSLTSRKNRIASCVDIGVPHMNLGKDPQLLIFLQGLEACQDINYHVYIRLVDALNSMVECKYKIETDGGNLRDRTVAFRILQRVRDIIRLLESDLEQTTLPPRDIIHSQNTLKNICVVVESYYKVIISLTSNEYIQ